MSPILPENPQLVKIIEYVLQNWHWMLLVLIIGLGWLHQMDEQP